MKVGDIVRYVETWQIGIVVKTIRVNTYKYHWTYIAETRDTILLLESELDLIKSGQKMSLTNIIDEL